jgi:hypothetical protein
MRGRSIAVALIAAGMIAAPGLSSRAAENENNAAALAKALAEASLPLEQGIRASEREGKPISAKYEIEGGALQLSVYTTKGNDFSEVIVDEKSGAIKKSEKITDADDLKDAKEQSQAMAKAKLGLDKAVDNAVKANGGYRAVSVMPMLKGGVPMAEVTLMKDTAVRKIAEKLD